MKDERRTDGDFVPLSNLSLHVLLALTDGPEHGYRIGKEVEDRSSGKLKPTTGSLYQALRRLNEDDLIDEAPRPAGEDERRQYFRLTPLGRRVLRLEAQRLDGLVALAREKKLLPGRP